MWDFTVIVMLSTISEWFTVLITVNRIITILNYNDPVWNGEKKDLDLGETVSRLHFTKERKTRN